MQRSFLTLFACLLPAAALLAQTMKAPDITKTPTLYVVPYAHLDTQWRWEFPADHQRISAEDHARELRSDRKISALRLQLDRRQPLPPDEGIFPRRLRADEAVRGRGQLVSRRARRWKKATSICPTRKAIFRQILYGNTYFRREFGKASAEYMLPDCFGFPASLPSILAHAGVKGFSTQKLSSGWQPAPRVGGPIRRNRRRKAFRSTSASGKAPTARPSSPRSIPAATAAACLPT